MKITSPIVGEMEVSSDRVIAFPSGLPGFEACCQFTLVHSADTQTPNLFVLQCLDDPQVAFTVTTPDVLGLNYEFALTDSETATLELAAPEDASVLLMVSREAANTPIHANVMAPLVVNIATRRGMQKIIGKVDTSVTLKAVA